MRNLSLLLTAAVLAGCDRQAAPEAVMEPSYGQVPVLIERAWAGGAMWELVKPRPPGLGADEGRATHMYIIAPVDPADPLSPPISVPGLIDVGGRDHIAPGGPAHRQGFSGVARSVPLEVPGWTWFLEPMCEALPPFSDAVAWDWVTVSGHPCGRFAAVFAVRLEGEECVTPLTSVERVHAAIEQGLAEPGYPDEGGPWPFALRPMTAPKAGVVRPAAPTGCVAPGFRGG